MIEKIYMSWEDFGLAIDELVEEIDDNSFVDYDGVFGMPRGGLPIAVALSHRLGLPLLEDFEVTNETLIVDDINDTGKTLLGAAQTNDIATLYSTPWSVVKPLFFVRHKVSKDTWIIFPWEDWDYKTLFNDKTQFKGDSE